MYFLIDNTEPGQDVFFASTDGVEWKKDAFESEGEGSLEKSFEKLLKKLGITFEDVRGVAVRVGAGRFTATRLAVTFVNSLALALRIPVVGVQNNNMEGLKKLIDSMPVGQYVSAEYSAEPRLYGKNEK